MDIDALRLLDDVARRLSFAAVAEERGVSPSSVSRAVALLEQDLGVRLFQRTTRRMALTEAGSLFLDRVRGILDELDEAREQARAAQAEPTGTLRLTAPVAFGERLIVPLVPALRRAHPGLRLDLLLTDANVDIVAEGVDLAVRLGPRLSGDLVVTRLFSTRYRVCASPAYLAHGPPLDRPADLALHRCVLYTLPQFRSAWRFREAGTGVESEVQVDGDLAVSSALSLRSLVLQGAGPGLLADWLVRDDLAAGALVDVLPGHAAAATDFDTAAWMLYPSRSYVPRKCRVVVDFLRARLAHLHPGG